MSDIELEQLQTAIKRQWSRLPGKKAQPYVNAFTARVRSGTKITAKVVGNHGTYTVSIQLGTQDLTSACSCYIGKHGYCHHCEALAHTFVHDPSRFKVVKPRQCKDVRNLTDVRSYRYCQELCVKFLPSPTIFKNGRVLGTFPTGLDRQCSSILSEMKANKV